MATKVKEEPRVMEKIKKFYESDDEKYEILCYFLEQIIFDEMESRKIAPLGHYRIVNPTFYESEKRNINQKRKMLFNDRENIRLLNACSLMRVYVKNLPENTPRNVFTDLTCNLLIR